MFHLVTNGAHAWRRWLNLTLRAPWLQTYSELQMPRLKNHHILSLPSGCLRIISSKQLCQWNLRLSCAWKTTKVSFTWSKKRCLSAFSKAKFIICAMNSAQVRGRKPSVQQLEIVRIWKSCFVLVCAQSFLVAVYSVGHSAENIVPFPKQIYALTKTRIRRRAPNTDSVRMGMNNGEDRRFPI